MNVAIIPARGGSKRLPGKNIKHFLGKPIIAYSIEAAIFSGLFDRVLVTTDSEEIAKIAREYGAITPFLRPAELSDDQVGTAPVIEHALRWLQDQGDQIDYACCIYATAPLIQIEYLRQGYEILIEKGCSTSYSVTSFPFPVFRASKINEDGCLEMFWPEYELTRSQDLPEAYHDAGQFYWLNIDRFLQQRRLYVSDSRPVIVPRYLVQDIDTMEDWARAEYMYQAIGLAAKGRVDSVTSSFPTITTERLRIVSFKTAHITTEYISWLNDKELMQFSEQRHCLHTRAASEAYLSSFEGSDNLFLAIENFEGQLIGTMTVYQDLHNGIVDMGIMVGAKSARRKGYGYEAWEAVADWAVKNLKPRKLTAGCVAANAPMLKLMKNIGMQPDGVRVNHYLQKGQPADIVYMAKMIGE